MKELCQFSLQTCHTVRTQLELSCFYIDVFNPSSSSLGAGILMNHFWLYSTI